MKTLDREKELEYLQLVEALENQRNGDYREVLKDYEKFSQKGRILNYVYGIDIKISEGRGRGIFATKDIKSGELIVVE